MWLTFWDLWDLGARLHARVREIPTSGAEEIVVRPDMQDVQEDVQHLSKVEQLQEVFEPETPRLLRSKRSSWFTSIIGRYSGAVGAGNNNNDEPSVLLGEVD